MKDKESDLSIYVSSCMTRIFIFYPYFLNTNRLAGTALLAPVVNYWWSGLPANLTNEAFYQQFRRDQWAVCVAHYTPWLTHWWNTQRWFPSSSIIAGSPEIRSRQDKELQSKQVGSKECEVCDLSV